MTTDASFGIDALVRSMAVNSPCRHMLFFGAGTSITSGIASAWQCVWTWKRDIFLTAQPDVSPILLGDPTLPHVQRRIQVWLDAQNKFPPEGDAAEYQFYAEHCYPIARDRQKFFEHLIKQGVPSVGYRALGLLIEAGHFRWLWATNFDDMVDRARSGNRSRIVRQVGMDTRDRLVTHEPDDTGMTQVFLHGDYRYDALKNTDAELRALDAEFREALAHHCTHFPLVVVGYSGRDKSIMDSIDAAFSRPGTGGLYWLLTRGTRPSPRAEAAVALARKRGRQAAFVDHDGFDSVMTSLARFLLRDHPSAPLLEEVLRAAAPVKVGFSLRGYKDTGAILKSNSWPISVPDFVYELEVGRIKTWPDLRDRLNAANGRAVAGLLNNKIVALGLKPDLEACFGADVIKTLRQVPVSPEEMFWDDGVVLSALREAMVQTLGDEKLRVKREGRRWYIVDTSRSRRERVGRDEFTYFSAVELRIEQRAGRLYLSLIPDRYIPRRSKSREFTQKELASFKNQLLAKQYNQVFNDELNSWRERLRLKRGDDLSLVFPKGSETGFRFTIHKGPIFTPVCDKNGTTHSVRVDRALVHFKSFRLPEPPLQFHGGQDFHPIRGLLEHGPIELSSGGPVTPSIRLGVICPTEIKKEMHGFLRNLNLAHTSVETKREYLKEYPGFSAAFRIPLLVPSPGATEWIDVSSRVSATKGPDGLTEILGNITRGIDRIITAHQIDTICIFIPNAWSLFEHFEDGVDLDLHDQIKAYCALRGVRTQLIRESTVRKQQRAEVLWWLSLALYAKSLRTPWLLAKRDEDAAYVGIGYAMNRSDPNRPIVLGCSHVFQASGMGLRFQLTHVKDPVFMRRKPYLNRDDALRVGVQTRQLFFESLGKLPSRALVCKRTPFTKEELEGLRSGLQGVGSIDLLTIEFEPAWRYLAQDLRSHKSAMFPVPRGTVIGLDEETFLLWVHGRVDSINEKGFAYYQGKTRIPAPLRVRRYGGSSTIEQIATDLLGLSKMDWNTFDLYETMPAHLTTSGKVARVGRFLERLGATTLDYRLFM